ncbi:hypothetical protein BKA56DRAFT_609026 [Ilyonectria sp. MPI-CAGE-AT-0026]|nr:hypothetical protein BKA56DRAFT_609026 [Ilyonectria sp. MPI-CAGE-AT-0026]
MGKYTSNTKPKSTKSKELPKGQPKTSPLTANLTEDSSTFPSMRNASNLVEANPDTWSTVQSPMMARFLSDREVPFTGLARTAPWEHQFELPAGSRTMTVQATQGSASEADHANYEDYTNRETDKKEKKGKPSKVDKVDKVDKKLRKMYANRA